MTITEAAEALGLAPSTLRRQRQLGRLRASKMGSEWFVSASEVERYRAAHLRRPKPPLHMKPATAAVLNLLRARGADGLTEAEATSALACRRLAARVWELRAAGHRIDAIPERTPMGAVIRRYYLR